MAQPALGMGVDVPLRRGADDQTHWIWPIAPPLLWEWFGARSRGDDGAHGADVDACHPHEPPDADVRFAVRTVAPR